MSNPKVKGVEVEMGTGNVYADLGFADAPGGHPKSPSDGHFKIPQLSA